MKILLTLITLFCCITIYSQNGKFISIDAALKKKDSVIILQLSEITEKLPAEISEFKNLKVVRLINLKSSYDLADAFLKLSKNESIETLELYGNEHTIIPEEIQNIKSLRRVYLNSKSSINIEYSIQNLTKLPLLTDVSFHGMSFTNMPTSIEKIKNLKKLDVSYNYVLNLYQLISSISMLPIEELNLAYTNLTSIPSNFTTLKSLKMLNLEGNSQLNLSNAFNILCNLNIEQLDLSSMKLQMIPKEISKLITINRLELESMSAYFDNKKSFQHLSQMQNLEELNIQGNFFMTISNHISLLKNIKKLEVDGNCLSDSEYQKLIDNLPHVEIQNKIVC